MIKLHASYGLKVPADQEFSSKSYHASAEIEVAASETHVSTHLAKLWAELRDAVEKEVGCCSPSSNSTPAPATTKQINYLFACTRKLLNLNLEETRDWLKREYHTTVESLTKTLATIVIDDVKAKASKTEAGNAST